MLLKFFSSRTQKIPSNPAPDPEPGIKEVIVAEKPLIIQIIHAGGVIERYYMAFPAAWIMDKYPSFVLARPEIFRRPWDSVLRPEEILVLGQKYFLVPIRTVKKLRRRMWKPSIDMSNDLIGQDSDTASSKSMSICKVKPVTRRVRFKGIEGKSRSDSSVIMEDEGEMKKKRSLKGRGLRKRNVHFSPSLTMIEETEGSDY